MRTPTQRSREEDFVDRAGTEIDGFLLERLIGVGGLSEVYTARHAVFPGRFAVKIAKGKVSASLAKRFEREARILVALDHPHIVKGVASGVIDGSPYVVMHHLRGRTLRRLVDETGPLPVIRAARITAQIASGLAAAHDAMLVHRDLKPTNLIVSNDPTDHVRLLDFGIARAYDGDDMRTRLTKAGVTGTPLYMSPEQIAGEREVGPASDIYALGLIVCFMLTGQPPFNGTVSEVVHAHTHEPPPDLGEYGTLGALATSMLAKSPEDRPGSAREIAELIAGGAATVTVVPAPQDPTDTVVRPPHDVSFEAPLATVSEETRLPWGAIAVLLVGVVAVAATVTSAMIFGDETAAIPIPVQSVARPEAVPAPSATAPPPREVEPPATSPDPAEPSAPPKRRKKRRLVRRTAPAAPAPAATADTVSVTERLDALRARLVEIAARVPPETLAALESDYLAIRALASRSPPEDEALLVRLRKLELRTRRAAEAAR